MTVDTTKLRNPKNYAMDMGCSRQLIYRQIREGKLRAVRIDGVLFIVLK